MSLHNGLFPCCFISRMCGLHKGKILKPLVFTEE